MKLVDLANKIRYYLETFERDQIINQPNECKIRPYYHTSARRAGKYVQVSYVTYQDPFMLTKKEATTYLEWLQKGNQGTHLEAFKESGTKKRKKIYKRYVGSSDPFGNDHYCDVIFVDEKGEEVSEEEYWDWINGEDQ